MGDISDQVVKDLLAAMPEHWAKDEKSANYGIARALGEAIEKAILRERAVPRSIPMPKPSPPVSVNLGYAPSDDPVVTTLPEKD